MALESDTPKVRPLTLFALPRAWGNEQTPWYQYFSVIAVLLMLLAGGQIWAQGLFVLFVGVVLWRKPPRHTLSRQTEVFSLAAVAVVLLSFLPYVLYPFLRARWLRQGRWRGQMEQADIQGSFLYTPQPLLTLELLMLLLAVLALIALLVHLPVGTTQRWRLALTLTIGLAVLGSLSLLGGILSPENALLSALHPIAFPNFATAVAIGSLLAFALLISAIANRWIFGIVLMALCLWLNTTALLHSHSGLFSWTALIAIFWAVLQIVRKQKINGLWRATAILVFITAATLVILGNVERAHWIPDSTNPAQRQQVYYDSASIVMQQPAMGVGLGNFKYIFPFYQNRSLAQGAIDTPGNDWLLASVEGGLFGFSTFALLACALFILCLGRINRRSSPIRLAALGALLVFFAGSILQTPGHYLGTVLLGILCLQLARPTLDKERTHSLYPRWMLKSQAALLIVIGLLWLLAALLNGSWQSKIATQTASVNFVAAINQQDARAVDQYAQNWLRFTPLAWQPYMERAKARILIDRNLIDAKADMERALTLIPKRAELPLQQGILWLPHSKQEAELSFRHALERHSSDPEQIYNQIVALSARDRDFQRPLARLSQTNTDMRFAYLLGTLPNQFNSALSEELRNDASLRRFSEKQRHALLRRWALEGNSRNVIHYLTEHPETVNHSWYPRALALAQTDSFKEASELLSNSLPMAQIPAILTFPAHRMPMPLDGFELPSRPSVASLQPPSQDNAVNHLYANALLLEQLTGKQWEKAQETLNLLLDQPHAPAYAVYWRGRLYAEAGDYRKAWPFLEQYAQHYLERRWQEQAAEQSSELLATPTLSTQTLQRWEQTTPTDGITAE